MDDGSILYFGGYRKPEAGDYIRVYRNDQCLGWIHWTLKHDPVTRECNEFIWCYAFGAAGKAQIAYSLDDAKASITATFVEHMEALGFEVVGFSRKPKQENVDWVAILIAEMHEECKTSASVDYFMGHKQKRRLREMVKYERSQVQDAADKLFKKLWAEEHPEPELETR